MKPTKRSRFSLRSLAIYSAIFILTMLVYYALGGEAHFVYFGLIALGSGAATTLIEKWLSRNQDGVTQ
jgi:hypothetical protein